MTTPKKIWYSPNQFEAYGEEEIKAVTTCLRAGWLAGFGPKTKEFEQRVARYFGKKFGLFVNSGSAANMLAIMALKLQPGDEVITPACTFATTVAPLVQHGYEPVFCDVGINTYVPSVAQVTAKITPRTKAIMIPNLIGNKPLWGELRKYVDTLDQKIYLVEDSADTMTHTPETDIATTSFYASHIITAGGSGGMVMFNDEKQLKLATMYRDWGRIGNNSEDPTERFNHVIDGIPYDWKFMYGVVGYNFKSSEMNAAFGLIQMDRLPEFARFRRILMQRYLTRLGGSSFMLPDDTLAPNWLAIPIQYSGERKKLLEFLESRNIQTRVCFSGNITRHPAFREYYDRFPVSDHIMAHAFLLGCHHGMTLEDVDRVCDTLLEYEALDVLPSS